VSTDQINTPFATQVLISDVNRVGSSAFRDNGAQWRGSVQGCAAAGSEHSVHGLTVARTPSKIWVYRWARFFKRDRRLMRTYVATPKTIDSKWHVIDAEGQVLGRIATVAAKLLQGKHKPTYTPFIDTGDHVVIVNAEKVKLTGRKEEQKIYRRHSGYEGGLREERAKIVRQARPVRIVEEAVHGMLPKTTLGAAMYRKLKVYAGPEHPHTAQKPSTREVA
jgi:large subunit ribosomal protein L13